MQSIFKMSKASTENEHITESSGVPRILTGGEQIRLQVVCV